MNSIDAVLRTASPLNASSSSTSSSLNSSLSSLALSSNTSVGGSSSSGSTHSWYEAMARAWGQALDQQAQSITQLSNEVSNAGEDQPSQITELTAASLRFSFLSSNASTSTTSIGEALQSLGRKD